MTALQVATKQLFERLHDPSVEVVADFVVAPTSVEEAAAILAAAAEASIPVLFYGGGTHQQLGNPVAADLVITTTGLNRVIDYEPDDLTIRVEAGVTLAELDSVLAERNLTAVLPETEPDATVGGVVATGRSAYQRLRYGPTRDRVLQITAATGYGKVITGGSPVVKASTGYGMPRLYTGSLGSLGMVGSVLLKLWSKPIASATVTVDDADAARRPVYRPLAALGAGGVGMIYLGGTPEEVDAQVEELDSAHRDGLQWPEPYAEDLRLSFRVPVPLVDDAVFRARNLNASSWIAEYGVGIVDAGYQGIAPDGFASAREWAESVGGALVIEVAPDQLRTELGAWGTPPQSVDLQRAMKERFDPSGICNPGILPGGL